MSRSVRITVALVAASAMAVTACSSSAKSSPPQTAAAGGGTNAVAISSSAGVLVGPNGHTLYENTVDTATSITCTGSCAQVWPPVTGDPVANAPLDQVNFSTVARPDGTMQVTYEGHPLYYFAQDTSPGSMRGNGMADQGGTWHTAAAAAVSTTGGTSVAPPPSTSSSSSGGGYGGGGGY